MGNEEEARLSLAQAAFFEAVAGCMRRPDEALADDIVTGRLLERLGAALSPQEGSAMKRAFEDLSSFRQECASGGLDGVRLLLEVEYNRLFVGPAALLAPPYESYYASEARMPGGGRLRTESERAVLRMYEREGFTVSDERFELPDHIALELEFLFLLSHREAEAWASGDAAGAVSLQRVQAAFIDEHLGTWVGDLAERVRVGARIPFYPAVIDLVALYCL